ncbi:uncharacterized protein LY89DRAFT_762900 [Mollisia scopiformis]|uniref:Uncharacterized protein n=1 Tax=Mollisia scopiformis TaxID=149040 RepID=A0A194XS68_MOLSC|nr:uncharacterized protein LY89DRAFT_762900 [Mollisia scopiformis]KUJ22572.1 hypothetical protein LY89DRAFT_762900 [Mollisia scopiformis]
MATPIEMDDIAITMDIEVLMSKLTVLERTLSNQSQIESEFEDNDSITTISSDDFNDRSMDIRDARLANSILSLDEDIPEHIDASIKELLTTHNNTTGALGYMEFIVTEEYLEYKHSIAAKKATEKKLPRSKGRRSSQKQSTAVTVTEVD